MSPDEIKSILVAEYSDAKVLNDNLSTRWADAIDRYHCKPLKDDSKIEGRSKAITSEVRDSVESTLSMLGSMFLDDDPPIMFEPVNEADVKQAEQETNYVLYVIRNQNKGFESIYKQLKDGLLMKRGIVDVCWHSTVKREKEVYEGRMWNDFLLVQNDPEFEITAVEANINGQALPLEAVDPANPDIRLTFSGYRKKTNGQIKLINIPPEKFYIRRQHGSINVDDVMFCGYEWTATRSELLEMGYDPKLVAEIPSESTNAYDNRINRGLDSGITLKPNNIGTGSDRSREVVTLYKSFIRTDYNDDGYSELLLTITGGKNHEVILGQEEVGAITISAWTPVIEPYRFDGTDLYDMTADIQASKTSMVRKMMDSLHMTVDPRPIVVEAIAGVNTLDDLSVAGIGAPIRVQNAGAVEYMQIPFVGREVLPVLAYQDAVLESRTGVSKIAQGLDAETLSDSTNMVAAATLNQSLMRIKQMARVYAETGFRRMVELVHMMVMQYEPYERIADLGDGYTQVDPRSWRKGRNIIVRVGTGFPSRMERLAAFSGILANQEKIIAAQGGGEGALVGLENIYNALQDGLKASGIKSIGRYYKDPAKYQPPAEGTSVVDLAELELSIKAQKDAAEIEIQKMKLELERMKLSLYAREIELKNDKKNTD